MALHITSPIIIKYINATPKRSVIKSEIDFDIWFTKLVILSSAIGSSIALASFIKSEKTIILIIGIKTVQNKRINPPTPTAFLIKELDIKISPIQSDIKPPISGTLLLIVYFAVLIDIPSTPPAISP